MADKRISPEDLLKPSELRPDSLRSLIGSIEKSKGRFVGWEKYGQPVIDRIVLHTDVPLPQLDDMIRGLVARPELNIRLDILINGIPALERFANVRAEITGAPGM